jgi:uncharacterized protein (TIGR02246 family)
MSDNRPDDEAAIQTVMADSSTAWSAGDADGMVANYTEDATAIMPGSPRDGRDVIRENMALAFAGPLKDTSTYNKQLSLGFVGTDAAIVVSESGILLGGQTEVRSPGPRRHRVTLSGQLRVEIVGWVGTKSLRPRDNRCSARSAASSEPSRFPTTLSSRRRRRCALGADADRGAAVPRGGRDPARRRPTHRDRPDGGSTSATDRRRLVT